MTYNCHYELAPAAFERALEPCPLARIDRAQDAGIDCKQREIRRLQLEERRPLACSADSIELAQTRALCHQLVNTTGIRAGKSKVGFNLGFHRRARGFGFEKV